MTHKRLYRPVPHVPAPRLRDADGSMRQAPRRSAGHAATHPVPPLKGLPGTRATDVSYRALAPDGAGTGHRICTGTSESRLTAHYSLLTANSTYTFSAKEKDVETGLSYFDSRYYSSDLRSTAHEFGHLLGLDHVNDENNIMNDKTKGRVITGNQILEACGYFFNYDINRGIPHLEGRRKLRIKANTPRKHH